MLLEISIYVELLDGISQIPLFSQAMPPAAVPCVQLCHERLEYLKRKIIVTSSLKARFSDSEGTEQALKEFMRSVKTLRRIMTGCVTYLKVRFRNSSLITFIAALLLKCF